VNQRLNKVILVRVLHWMHPRITHDGCFEATSASYKTTRKGLLIPRERNKQLQKPNIPIPIISTFAHNTTNSKPIHSVRALGPHAEK